MFVDAFVTASLTVCAMAVIGAIQEGIAGEYSTLLLNAVLVMLLIFVMTASMIGKRLYFCRCSCGNLPWITLFARAVQPVMTDQALSNRFLTGSMLIFCVGVNLIWERKRFKVVNMLPAIVIAVVCAFAGIDQPKKEQSKKEG